MTSIIQNRQTVSPGVYSRTVTDQCSLPHDFMAANAHRVDRAYKAGEPIWMIVEELRMVFATRPARPTKTPRQMAARVVRA